MTPDIAALVERLRKGRLLRESQVVEIYGMMAETGEVRELAHPDALEAADALTRLSAEMEQTKGVLAALVVAADTLAEATNQGWIDDTIAQAQATLAPASSEGEE